MSYVMDKDGKIKVLVPGYSGGNMENPMTTQGDIIYGGAGGAPTRLGIGAADQVLTVNAGGTAPEWAAAAGGLTESRIGKICDPLSGAAVAAREAIWVRVVAMDNVTLTRVRAAVFAAGDDIRCRIVEVAGPAGNTTITAVEHETAYQAVAAPELADFVGLSVALTADKYYAAIVEVKTGATLQLYQDQTQLGYGSFLPSTSAVGGYCLRNAGVTDPLTAYGSSLPTMWLAYEV